jgi:hypothetical protein
MKSRDGMLKPSANGSPGPRFERIVGRIFQDNGFRVEFNQKIRSNNHHRIFDVDLVLTWDNSVSTVVEVKLFRSRAPNLSDLARASDHVQETQALLRADHAMVVTNLRRDRMPPQGAWPPGVVFVGLDDLVQLANSKFDLLSELADIDRELSSALREFDGAPDLVPASSPMDLSQFHVAATNRPPPPPSQPRKGHELAEVLRSVPAGKSRRVTLPSRRTGVPWRLFEDICMEALEYVFEGVLGNWKKQEAVSGDANRFDALAKIIGDDVFCRTLIEDFGSRYILFEFKNYAERVKPNLVHVTEKYLFPTALRATAVIISPKGLAPESVQATHGALRDVGKLILDMDTNMLFELLEDKDNGTTPSAKMESHLDKFLQQVGR